MSKLVINENIKEVTNTVGTGDLTLSGPVYGKQGFYSHCVDGDICWYELTDGTDDVWEIGKGTWRTGNILERTYVYSSSNNNSAVNLVAGPKYVCITRPINEGALVTPYVNRTSTGTAHTGVGEFAGYICTVAAGNITIYDNTSAAGTVIVPTTALTLGAHPIFGAGTNGRLELKTGCHVVLSGAATVNVLVG